MLPYMSGMFRLAFGTGLAILVGTAQAAVNNRFYIADQSDFGHKLGFFLDFENSASDGQICQASSIIPYFGVADGQNWRFVTTHSSFQVGQSIHIVATISSTGATLDIDGQTVQTKGSFKPFGPNVTTASVPGWANGPTAYRVVERSLTITVDSTPHVFSFPTNSFSPVMQLFESQLPVVQPVPILTGQAVVIDATVMIEPLVDLNAFKPIIDAFGQVSAASFPGKIKSLSDLNAAFTADDHQLAEWKPRQDVDAFGGELKVSWAQKGTGYYRAFKRNGFWWLLSPLGNPEFYTGVCTAPAIQWDSTPVTGRKDLFAELPPETGITPSLWTHNVWGSDNLDYAAIHGLNLLRRFGPISYDDKARQECKQRIASWGFSGQGKWAQPLPKTPFLPVISCPDVPRIDRHFDVFDSTIKAKLRASLEAKLRPDLNNPYILGNSFGNEYDEIVIPSEIVHILASKEASPAKKAFIAYATRHLYAGNETALREAWGVRNGGDLDNQPLNATTSDTESLRRFYASNYYSTLYMTFKSVDPNHLYFGFWIVPDWWVSDEDWNLIAPNVDVIGFDRYADWPGIESLLNRFDKPALLGEFSFPSWYAGARGFGRYSTYTNNDAESGQHYSTLLSSAAKSPQCVGTMWFQYRDEPLTGRGPSTGTGPVQGEHYAFGLVNACDVPKYDLVRPVRAANLAANSARLAATN